MNRTIKSIGLVAVLLALGITAGCAPFKHTCLEWMARAAVYAPNTDKTVSATNDPDAAELAQLHVNRQLRVDVQPQASLSLWILEPSDPSKMISNQQPRATILVLHGIQDSKRSMLGVGKQLATEGFRVVLVDSRGHGRSTGKWLTYGVLESRDLVQVLDALALQESIGRVGVYGVSFGGATAIEFAALEPRVSAVVAITPFTSMREELHHYARRTFPVCFAPNPWIDEAITQAGTMAGFDPILASPLDAIRRTRAQVLLVHGTADKKIPFQQSRTLHEAATDHSKLLLLDHEDHDSIVLDRQGILSRESVRWFKQWLVDR